MNKKGLLGLMVLFLSIAVFTTCKKNRDIDIDCFKIISQKVDSITANSVYISGSYSYTGGMEIGIKVKIWNEGKVFDTVCEMDLEETNFSKHIGGLKTSTEYCYRYIVVFGTNDVHEIDSTFKFETGKLYIITAIPNNNKWGTVSGGGQYNSGDTCKLIASHTQGCQFSYWTEDGQVIEGEGATYSFLVTGDRTLVANFTANPQTYIINVSASPTSGGSPYVGSTPGVTSGMYANGQLCTVHANSNAGYSFDNWTENGNVVPDVGADYTFQVTSNRILVANFSQQSYMINASANPSNGGTVAGTGSYNYGQSCTLSAIASEGYTFTNWTENGNVVSTNLNYPFTVTGNRSLVANFDSYLINGKFSINANHDQVYFSKGNLQYTISTQTWSFMEHQYDVVETSGQDVGDNYSNQDVISLFGWGTSGNDHGAVCYQPWSSSINSYDYYAYDDPTANLNANTGQADWGYNAISNGGNQQQKWRTLTKDEWVYVINKRITPSGIRYAKAKVNDINGVILIPDDWNNCYCDLDSPNSYNADFDTNIINVDLWNFLEQKGAVFLPAAGCRRGTNIYGGEGNYWSSSVATTDNAWHVGFNTNYFDSQTNNRRDRGYSVRLVLYAE